MINAPTTLYDFYIKNKTVVFIAISIFLSTIVGILLFVGFKIRRTNRKLTLSGGKYRSIFEHTGTAMMMIAIDTTITMVNSEFEILSGYRREDVEMKKSWRQFAHQADIKKMLAYHEQRRSNARDVPINYEFRFINKQGEERHVFVTVGMIQGTDHSVASLIDITDRISVEREKEHLIVELKHALNNIKTLKGLLPICSYCKKIRDDKGYWKQIESYIQEHSGAEFSHGICRDCANEHYPDLDVYDD